MRDVATFTVYGRLPGLNEYTAACRTNASKHVVGFNDIFDIDRRDPRVVVTIERRPA